MTNKLLNKEIQEDIARRIRSGELTVEKFREILNESDKRLRIAANEYFIGLRKIDYD